MDSVIDEARNVETPQRTTIPSEGNASWTTSEKSSFELTPLGLETLRRVVEHQIVPSQKLLQGAMQGIWRIPILKYPFCQLHVDVHNLP